MNIILIGFMCSGKTTIASLLGKRLGINVIETDELIRQRAGMTTDEIFKQLGETGYREYEIAVAKEIKDKTHTVISTGGGFVMNNITIEYLKSNAKIIFLQTSLAMLYKRLEGSFARPLFNNEERTKKLYNLRLPLYTYYADIIIETDTKNPDEVTDEILSKLQI